MGKMVINNLYGADIELTSTCGICGKEHKYRVKEKKTCANEECYKESMIRRNKQFNGKPRI